MNRVEEFVLKALRKVYSIVLNKKPVLFLYEDNPDNVSNAIYEALTGDKPCMIARFGSTELNLIANYWSIQNHQGEYFNYISGKIPQWWWNKQGIFEIKNNSGFFPLEIDLLKRFSSMMILDMPLVDILGCWRPEEKYFENELRNSKKVRFLCMEPYWSKNPWSRALEGKRVVVVHPFAEDIENQYFNNREFLFNDSNVLPKFSSLRTIKAVQSLGGDNQDFCDWFEALSWMQKEMDKEPYDIALIGCGAYGFPLAAYAKRTGHKAIHLGGALQLLFGIKGKRWEDPNYNDTYKYNQFFNQYWIYPNKNTMPKNAQQVEGATYWK